MIRRRVAAANLLRRCAVNQKLLRITVWPVGSSDRTCSRSPPTSTSTPTGANDLCNGVAFSVGADSERGKHASDQSAGVIADHDSDE